VRSVGTDSKDAEIHEDIYNALGWAAFGSSAGNINAGIEWTVNKLLDAAELIPGVGQGIMLGRLALEVEEFLRQGGLDELKMLAGGLSGIAELVEENIGNFFSRENLIEFLLFGSRKLDALL